MRRSLIRWTMLPLLVAGIFGCSPCKENVVGHVFSEEYVATLSKRDCGAMSGGSTLVSVRFKSVPDNDTHGVIIFALRGDRNIQMTWKDAHNLVLDCFSCTQNEVTFKAVKSGDVVISYISENSGP
jgi:hypothetical protein